MKHSSTRTRATTGLIVCLAALGALLTLPFGPLASGSCADDQQEKQAESKPPALPPLVIDKGAPLLLDEPAKSADKSFLKINDACYVCHGNLRDEELAVVHAKEEIGCTDCHGQSMEHRKDEDNVTAPEIMYPANKIDSLCRECHDKHDVPAKDVLKRWRQRCPQKTDADTIVCTDCHGHHRLKRRTVRWDKETGDLLPQPKGKSKGTND